MTGRATLDLGEPQRGPHCSPHSLGGEPRQCEQQERQHGQDEVEAPPHRHTAGSAGVPACGS
jgi:hypothetical protein